MKSVLLLLISSFWMTSAVYGADSCEALFHTSGDGGHSKTTLDGHKKQQSQGETILGTKLWFLRAADKRVPQQDRDRVANALSLAEAVLPASMIKPPNIMIELLPEHDDSAEAHSGKVLLYLPNKLGMESVTIHEYGHWIFNLNKSKYDKEWEIEANRATDPNIMMFQERIQEIIERRDNIETPPASANDEDYDRYLNERLRLQTELQSLLTQHNQELELKYGKREGTRAYEHFLLSLRYEELFADVLAVVALRNPRALASGLKALGTSDVKGRDFSKSISQKGWAEKGQHHFYDPVRSFIGAHFLRRISSRAQASDFLARFHDTLTKDLLRSEKSSDESTEDLNARLIDALSKEFAITPYMRLRARVRRFCSGQACGSS